MSRRKPGSSSRKTTMTDQKTVGVVGCGLMGSGIAQVCAEAGHSVIVREVNDAALARGLGSIDKFLSKGVDVVRSDESEDTAVTGRGERSWLGRW